MPTKIEKRQIALMLDVRALERATALIPYFSEEGGTSITRAEVVRAAVMAGLLVLEQRRDRERAAGRFAR